MTGAEKLHVLEPYRGKPPDVQYSRREHAPVCRWCTWRDMVKPYYCFAVGNNPTGGQRFANLFNERGQCNYYRPSLWTRLLQALRVRPWIERKTENDD